MYRDETACQISSQRPFSSKVIVRTQRTHADTHRTDVLSGPLKWAVTA